MAPIVVAGLVAPIAQAGGCWSYRRPERRLARKINRERAKRSIDGVKLDRQLSKVSRVHTRVMIKRGKVFHTADATLAQRVTNWTVLGENVGSTRGGVRRIFRSMMRSALHRANMLNSTFNYVGVGTKRGKGRLWVTITLEAVDNPGTTLSMPSC
ncbi:MAG: CAP domain-containing protein [Actinomycetota bacterium]